MAKILMNEKANYNFCLPSWWINKPFACFQCSCVFEVEEGETVYYGFKEDRLTESYVSAVCPLCAELVRSSIPYEYARLIKNCEDTYREVTLG